MTLTDQELIILDGKCSQEVQAEVDAAKSRLQMRERIGSVDSHIADFVADAVAEAKKNGRLIFEHLQLRACKYCKKQAGYWPYARWSRNHRKGAANYDAPKYFYGINVAHRFIIMKGYASLGCCAECWEKAKPILLAELEGMKCELSKYLTGIEPKYRRYDKMKCSKCNWEGHEGQMGKLRTLMGDGWYRGKCPQCGSENSLFNSVIKPSSGFVIAESTD